MGCCTRLTDFTHHRFSQHHREPILVMGVTPEELAAVYPRLYHMANAQSWNNIRKHGLLSTSSLLDLFEIKGECRIAIEARRRPHCVPLKHAKHGDAVVRDNKSSIDSKLEKSLRGCTLEEWYRLLNSRVFFWVTRERLQKFLCARAYRDQSHAVLMIDTLPFVKCHEDKIVLSPMNSGNTQPIAHPRGPETFKKMSDYPFNERAKYGDYYQAVELAVEGGADVCQAVLSVDLMQCGEKSIRELNNIFRRG